MIHLNIGSNLDSIFGSRFDNISIAINLLMNSKVKIKKISNFYETPSYPNNNFPKFLNVGVIIDYKNDYHNLFKLLKQIEKRLGRIRTKKNDPRVIDIDIIDFRSEVKRTKELILPHPRCHVRNFVLFPILQIDPNWSHPLLKQNAQYLINNLNLRFRIEITKLKKNVNI